MRRSGPEWEPYDVTDVAQDDRRADRSDPSNVTRTGIRSGHCDLDTFLGYSHLGFQTSDVLDQLDGDCDPPPCHLVRNHSMLEECFCFVDGHLSTVWQDARKVPGMCLCCVELQYDAGCLPLLDESSTFLCTQIATSYYGTDPVVFVGYESRRTFDPYPTKRCHRLKYNQRTRLASPQMRQLDIPFTNDDLEPAIVETKPHRRH